MEARDWVFMASDGLVALICCFGNCLILVAFYRDRSLRTITNAYVASLAVADLLVGLVGIPLTLFTMVTQRPGNVFACLLFNTWIMMLCTVSILHLLAVSYDRYLVIVVEMAPVARSVKRRRAMVLLVAAWVLGAFVGFLPLIGWSKTPPQPRCVFLEVMDLSYLVALFGGTMIFPTFLMAFFYTRIYLRVHRHQRNTAQLRRASLNPAMSTDRHEAKRRKVLVSLFIVIVSFLVGWYPLYSLNTLLYFCPDCPQVPAWLFFTSIVLTHLTSAVNPLIYAYTMPGFAAAFRSVLCPAYAKRAAVGVETVEASTALVTCNGASLHSARPRPPDRYACPGEAKEDAREPSLPLVSPLSEEESSQSLLLASTPTPTPPPFSNSAHSFDPNNDVML